MLVTFQRVLSGATHKVIHKVTHKLTSRCPCSESIIHTVLLLLFEFTCIFPYCVLYWDRRFVIYNL